MSSSRPSSKPSSPNKEAEPKSSRVSPTQVATPPPGAGQRRSVSSSQRGSSANRSNANSATPSASGREKISSAAVAAANKTNAPSPLPSKTRNFFSLLLTKDFHRFQLPNHQHQEMKLLKMLNVKSRNFSFFTFLSSENSFRFTTGSSFNSHLFINPRNFTDSC